MSELKKDLNYYMSLPYRIEVEPISPEDGGGFAASMPQLGKFSVVADGETPEEAIRNLEEIKRERFSEYIHQGVAIPEPQRHEEQYSGKFVLRIPKYLHRELASAARENDVSLNQFLVSLLAAGVEKHKCL